MVKMVKKIIFFQVMLNHNLMYSKNLTIFVKNGQKKKKIPSQMEEAPQKWAKN